jgi:hypothetical protein
LQQSAFEEHNAPGFPQGLPVGGGVVVWSLSQSLLSSQSKLQQSVSCVQLCDASTHPVGGGPTGMPGWSLSQVPLSSQSSLQHSVLEVQMAPDPTHPVGGLTDWSLSQTPLSSQSRLQHWAFEEHAAPATLQGLPLGLSSASSPHPGTCMRAKAKGSAPRNRKRPERFFEVVMATVYQAGAARSNVLSAPRATRRYPVSGVQVFRGIAGNPLPQQRMSEPDQQPRTARKYRTRPGGDAGPEITNGLGAFLYAARSEHGFRRVLGDTTPTHQPVEG